MRQSQFEDIADDVALKALIEERLFSINQTSWEGDAVSFPELPPRWIIADIDYQRVRIRVSNTTFLEPYMMTYTMTREAKDGGQLDRRALVDNFILTTPNDLTTKVSYRDPTNGQAVVDALLNKDGTKLADQTGDPEYENYKTQPLIPWTFLRT